jgi:hypothetical protein
MYVCVCVYADHACKSLWLILFCTCMYVCILCDKGHAFPLSCFQGTVHVSIQICIYLHTHRPCLHMAGIALVLNACIHVYIYISSKYIHIYTHTHIYICVFMCVCTYTLIHTRLTRGGRVAAGWRAAVPTLMWCLSFCTCSKVASSTLCNVGFRSIGGSSSTSFRSLCVHVVCVYVYNINLCLIRSIGGSSSTSLCSMHVDSRTFVLCINCAYFVWYNEAD